MGLPVDHMPTGGIPCVLPVAFRHWLPFPGLGTMPNNHLLQCHYYLSCSCTEQVRKLIVAVLQLLWTFISHPAHLYSACQPWDSSYLVTFPIYH